MKTITFGFAILILLTLASEVSFGQSSATHPLDPLTAEEISSAVSTLTASGKVNETTRYSTIVLNEPPKQEVLDFKAGQSFRREALVIAFEREARRTFEGLVDLRAGKLLSWKEVRNVQPSFTLEDVILITSIVRGDKTWQEAVRKRGIEDFASVQVDAWSAGYFGFPDEIGKRVARGICFYRPKGDRNPYPHPIEGLVAVVDLSNKKMLRVEDTGVVPVPQRRDELSVDANQPLRERPAPLVISQPDGYGFKLNGNQVIWQNWKFRYALHPREGLVLYTVSYNDHGNERSILYRGSLSEMVVPYGDPSAGWFIRNAFDEGEYGIGALALPLEDKSDVPANAVLIDASLSNERGRIQNKPRSVAVYERDGGILWKHADWVTNRNESRRARELVLTSYSNVGNYEYGFSWIFHQDGTIEMEVQLTGIMAVRALDSSRADSMHHLPHGHLVAPAIEAVHHQHFFNFRLDMDIDGAGGNQLLEQNTAAIPPGRNNPRSNAFTMTETVLGRELMARRQLNLASNRRWKVVNSKETNELGLHPGYLLFPGENSVSFSGPGSMVRKRAGFMNYHLWGTAYQPDELNSAGRYVNQSTGGDGLMKWTSANRDLSGKDVVIWYSMGITHIPRPEDWPVMPVHKAGFKLMPNGFFTRNPSMDVPR